MYADTSCYVTTNVSLSLVTLGENSTNLRKIFIRAEFIHALLYSLSVLEAVKGVKSFFVTDHSNMSYKKHKKILYKKCTAYFFHTSNLFGTNLVRMLTRSE